MTKKLLVQIKNEWRNNLWLALELLVVSLFLSKFHLAPFERLQCPY